MTRRFLMTVFTTLILVTAFSLTSQARELPKPQFTAVYFYADWCPVCKVLSPKIEKAKVDDNLNREDILFVKLDLTDKPRIHQSILLAQGLGIGEFLKTQGSGTGYIAILDAETKEEVLRFNGEASTKDIQSGFQALLEEKSEAN